MADSKITALTALTAADPANDMIPIVDVSDTPPASGNTKRISINNILACSPTATLASATITGDLTVATDRLKVVTASTAIQTGATTQLQVGTTSWPSTVIGKSGSRSLFGNTGEVIIWNETAAAIGNYSTLFVTAKTGAGATTMGGLQIRAGIENASNSDGFVSLFTSNNAAGGFVERYKIDSTGVSTWSVGGSTAMTLNSTGLGVGGPPAGGMLLTVGGTSSVSATANALQVLSSKGTFNVVTDGSTNAAGTTITYSWANGGQGPLIFRNASISNVMTLDASGNVGIGVTPSAWGVAFKAAQLSYGGLYSQAFTVTGIASNCYNAGAGGWTYFGSGQTASRYEQSVGTHAWYTAAAGTGAIGTFTQAMTLDASGRLITNSSTFTPPTLNTNGDLNFIATSNTNVRFSYRGTDGVTRVANITLA